MQSHERFGTVKNGLLLRLPATDRRHLARIFKREELPAKMYLERCGCRASKVYFIERGVVSSLETGDRRDPIEVGVVGCEGMVGTSAIADLIPQRDSYVQIAGEALVLGVAQVQEFLAISQAFRSYLFRYVQTQIVQVSLAASAGVRANVQQRLARKLLMYHDRVGVDGIALTHESISLMLGVRRASVTNAVHNLEGEGLIAAHRGLITIRDRSGLERYCGRFYGVAEERYAQIMDGSIHVVEREAG